MYVHVPIVTEHNLIKMPLIKILLTIDLISNIILLIRSIYYIFESVENVEIQ